MPPSKPPLSRVLDARFVASATRFEQLPAPQHLEIAFAGRSNVGKSSLMNALLERKKLVRTSSTPGCTRQISLFEVTTRKGSRLTFVDLPGYGYAKRSHSERKEWAELIHSYLANRTGLALVALLVDIRRGLETEDQQLIDLVSSVPRVSRAPVELVPVATKLDKLSGSERKLTLAQLKKATGMPWLGFSIEMQETHAPLWQRLLQSLELEQPATPPAPESTD